MVHQIAPVPIQAKWEHLNWRCNCGTVNDVNNPRCLRCRSLRMSTHASGGGPQHPYAGNQPANAQRSQAIGRSPPPQGGLLPGLNSTPDLDKLEIEFNDITADKKKLAKLWNRIDYNGNGLVSLAEIDKLVVDQYPQLNHKPALMRAYKWACSAASGGDGDDWVEKKEFRTLLAALVYFNRIFKLFVEIDGGGDNGDRRLTLDEFVRGVDALNFGKTKKEAESIFRQLDRNNGGFVLFDEFCGWAVHSKLRALDPFSY